MSVVCCKLCDGQIKVASDSIAVYGSTQERFCGKGSKLCEINGMIIGGVGGYEEMSMLQIFAATRKPTQSQEGAILEFMAEFSEWKKKKTENHAIGNDYIIAFNGRVFVTFGLFIQQVSDYAAIGAGRDFANAALYLGHGVEKAVDVACELSIYCEKPIQVLTMTMI